MITAKKAIGVTMRMKKYFFDRVEVQRKLGKIRARFLRNVGGYTQTTAKRSMRRAGKKGKPSPAGQPPKYHGGEPSLRTILYGMDPATGGMLVGPVLLNGRSNPTIPELHEYGGKKQIREKKVGDKWVSVGKRKPKPGQPTRRRMAVYPARPTMGPATAKTIKKFPRLMYGMA